MARLPRRYHKGEFIVNPKVVCFGELLIDFVALARDVSVGYADRFQKVAGGAPANVAVGLAKLGIPSAFITQLGNDPFGHFLKNTLDDNDVDTTAIAFTDKARTALAFVSVEASGERSFAFYRHPSADMLMTPDSLNHTMIQQATIFHFGSITLIDDPVRATTLAAIDMARQYGATISYDPNLRPALWPSLDAAKTGMLTGLQQATIAKMNEEEVKFLTGKDNLPSDIDMVEAAHSLWHADLRLLVITRGPAGCLAITPSAFWSVQGYTVQVEDTIGAGDGFMAGLLAGIATQPAASLDSKDLILPALQQANAVGALTASRRGAIPALPGMDTVQVFLTERATR